MGHATSEVHKNYASVIGRVAGHTSKWDPPKVSHARSFYKRMQARIYDKLKGCRVKREGQCLGKKLREKERNPFQY